jgi:tyrosyl-tRNA synthetase
MEAQGMRPQVVLTFPILVGTDGVLRMSKSMGNYIGINESPGVIFTKVLNLPDHTMRNYAELVTRWRQQDIDAWLAQTENGTLPIREFKHMLAREIVSIFHGDEAAERAAEDASRMHQGEAPSDAPVFTLQSPKAIIDVLSEAGLVKSRGEARRLIDQGGVRINGDAISDIEQVVTPAPNGETVIQVGKRKFLRVKGE